LSRRTTNDRTRAIDRLNDSAGLMFNNSVIVVAPCVARMLAAVELETAFVVMVNAAEVAPAAIVTEVGVVALTMLDDKKITAPPGPAGPFSVTVPVLD